MLDPIETWMSLLGQGGELTEAYWDAHAQHMRDARLVFGGRLSCPFLRPLFLDARDEAIPGTRTPARPVASTRSSCPTR
jgi:hypothetical protein